jgi:DNA polymerase III epsilon subunit
MREIVLDTETTGFEPSEGDRIVEIGAVELFNHLPTGRTYHQYINPERNMPEAAFNVHGLSEEFLSDKPIFKNIAQEFIDFHCGLQACHTQCIFRHEIFECRTWLGQSADFAKRSSH